MLYIIHLEIMTIKVLVDTIRNEDIQNILDYYNQNKPTDSESLQLLDRYEGGFQIYLTEMKDIKCDINKKIKQLRWDKGCLVSSYYIGFDRDETELLHNALIHVLGQENVVIVY